MLFMALTILNWGFTWIVLKTLAAYMGPFDLVAWRYALGSGLLFAIMVASGKSLEPPPWGLTLAIGLSQTAAFSCLSQFALITGAAGQVAMLSYTMPFWVVLFAWLILRQPPTAWHLAGGALAAVGLIAIMAPWRGSTGLISSALAVMSGAAWALGTVFSKMMFQRHAPKVLNLTAWQMLLGTAFTLPFAVLQNQTAPDWRPELILGLIYLSIISTAAGWLLWLQVVRRVSATLASMSSLGVPVMALVLAWLLLGERPDALETGGIILILAGLVVVNLGSLRRVG